MDFGGELAVLDPSMVFQITNLCGLTGRMKFITADNVASCWFKEGELLYATIDTRRRKIGEVLVEKKMITGRQLEEALEESRSRTKKTRLGNILIEKGHLDFETLVSAIQDQMKEVVYEVLPWNKGQFVFFSGVEPEQEDILLDVRVDHLILEGLKRMDESIRD
ncbi:MAG: DUF4388 domain-containing protein [Candidatus Krumholzibacteria bacterium]|nr:DUF4388 domain-containing protein [Candidatus Krumholzibacteria bacterium]